MKHRLNLNGKRFGMLLVLSRDPENIDNVICQCDCGQIKSIKAISITKSTKPIRDCGCVKNKKLAEFKKREIAENPNDIVAANLRFKTNFGVIASDKVPKHNKSGHKGVCYNPQTNSYRAYICVKGKQTHLGSFSTFKKAVEVREEAERKYYAPLISEREKEMKTGCG